MRTLSLLAFLFCLPVCLAQKEFGFDNRKGSGQPYLSPEETVQRMKVPPEFEVKLFAAEPMLTNPIAFTMDEKGRVWAIESFEYPKRTPKGQKPRDRIVILEDTDGDGKADKRTVFAEGKDFPESFDMASGIEVGHGGVYVGAAPYLWFIENKNDKPGKFEILLKGFGSQDTHETLNTFQWGPDGWLYGLHGIFTQANVSGPNDDAPPTKMNAAVWRFHPTKKKFEIFAEGTSNPWGMDWRNTDGEFILACCVIPHLYHIVPGGIYKRQAGASYNPYAYGYIPEISDHTFHKESGWAHAGLISLDVPHMPERFRNSVIFGSIHGCSLKQNILKPKGSSFTASRGDDFLVSGDKNVRPINLRWGPHGDIYLSDWHDQNPCHQTKPDDWDYERGRIYRIQLKGTKTKKAEDLSNLTNEEIIDGVLVTEQNPYRYRTALRLLSERSAKLGENTKDKARILAGLGVADTPIRLRGLWASILAGKHEDVRYTEDGLMASRPEALRVGTVRFAGFNDPHMQKFESTWSKTVKERMGHLLEQAKADKSPSVRRELASAAINLEKSQDVLPLIHALMAHTDDANDPLIPHLVWLAYEKAIAKKQGAVNPAEKELAWLLEQAPANIFIRDHIIGKVMRRLVATGQPEDLALCVKFVKELKDTHSREKALDGLTIALDKQQVNPPAGWAELQKELLADAKLVKLTNKLSVSFRDPEALKRAFTIAQSTTSTVEDRAEALRQLVLLKHPEAQSTVLKILNGNNDVKLRVEAARTLVSVDNPKLADGIIQQFSTYPKAVQNELVAALASRKAWAKELLLALQSKKLERTLLNDSIITRIQSFKDKELDSLIEKAWGRTRVTPDELMKQIDTMRVKLNAAPASYTKGKAVFEAQCAKCHKFEGAGADVGPALDGAARDIEYLLGNIIDPNRVIGAPYFIRQVNTLGGELIQGVLAEEDPMSITLKVEQGQLKKILKKNIDGEVKVLEKSMMPEGLAAGMTEQDFRDLVRYVMASPYLTQATVDGIKVTAPVTGAIAIPVDKVGKDVVIEAKFKTATAGSNKLLIGAGDAYVVELDGKKVGTGVGQGKKVNPDLDVHAVELSAGEHTVRIKLKAKDGAVVYAKVLDPDRKMTQGD